MSAAERKPTKTDIDITRARTGLGVVLAGDIVILLATAGAVWKLTDGPAASTASTAIISILTSAFTTIGTMTTAYFGIRAATNTAQTSINRTATPDDGNDQTVARGEVVTP
ncbi:hypothetical protein ACPPVT_05735 [Angustibacter sp. McL0619]|uniref:hypothetical protein n=1 Tax=Angustibacter sp. McL0619 TaxID=3415676 RepID=UPI003CEAC35B